MEIKKHLYEKLKQTNIPIVDNPYSVEKDKFPFMILRTSNISTRVRNKTKHASYVFLLDIYSNYEGEKEVYDIYNKVLEILEEIYKIDGITRISDNGIKIIDDKSLGVVRKHGIMAFSVSTSTLMEGVI